MQRWSSLSWPMSSSSTSPRSRTAHTHISAMPLLLLLVAALAVVAAASPLDVLSRAASSSSSSSTAASATSAASPFSPPQQQQQQQQQTRQQRRLLQTATAAAADTTVTYRRQTRGVRLNCDYKSLSLPFAPPPPTNRFDMDFPIDALSYTPSVWPVLKSQASEDVYVDVVLALRFFVTSGVAGRTNGVVPDFCEITLMGGQTFDLVIPGAGVLSTDGTVSLKVWNGAAQAGGTGGRVYPSRHVTALTCFDESIGGIDHPRTAVVVEWSHDEAHKAAHRAGVRHTHAIRNDVAHTLTNEHNRNVNQEKDKVLSMRAPKPELQFALRPTLKPGSVTVSVLTRNGLDARRLMPGFEDGTVYAIKHEIDVSPAFIATHFPLTIVVTAEFTRGVYVDLDTDSQFNVGLRLLDDEVATDRGLVMWARAGRRLTGDATTASFIANFTIGDDAEHSLVPGVYAMRHLFLSTPGETATASATTTSVDMPSLSAGAAATGVTVTPPGAFDLEKAYNKDFLETKIHVRGVQIAPEWAYYLTNLTLIDGNGNSHNAVADDPDVTTASAATGGAPRPQTTELRSAAAATAATGVADFTDTHHPRSLSTVTVQYSLYHTNVRRLIERASGVADGSTAGAAGVPSAADGGTGDGTPPPAAGTVAAGVTVVDGDMGTTHIPEVTLPLRPRAAQLAFTFTHTEFDGSGGGAASTPRQTFTLYGATPAPQERYGEAHEYKRDMENMRASGVVPWTHVGGVYELTRVALTMNGWEDRPYVLEGSNLKNTLVRSRVPGGGVVRVFVNNTYHTQPDLEPPVLVGIDLRTLNMTKVADPAVSDQDTRVVARVYDASGVAGISMTFVDYTQLIAANTPVTGQYHHTLVYQTASATWRNVAGKLSVNTTRDCELELAVSRVDGVTAAGLSLHSITLTDNAGNARTVRTDRYTGSPLDDGTRAHVPPMTCHKYATGVCTATPLRAGPEVGDDVDIYATTDQQRTCTYSPMSLRAERAVVPGDPLPPSLVDTGGGDGSEVVVDDNTIFIVLVGGGCLCLAYVALFFVWRVRKNRQ